MRSLYFERIPVVTLSAAKGPAPKARSRRFARRFKVRFWHGVGWLKPEQPAIYLLQRLSLLSPGIFETESERGDRLFHFLRQIREHVDQFIVLGQAEPDDRRGIEQIVG